jgi:23S rRNA G2445 N2-methylase RlmL
VKFEHAPADSYADVASGAVLHSAPGFPSFPARLALELFDRARALTGRNQVGLWDPACGAGGLVTTLAMLRRSHLRIVRAGDVDPDAVTLARRNLSLTTLTGLQRRIDTLRSSDADRQRLESAERLVTLVNGAPPLDVHVEQADATQEHPPSPNIDVALSDLPYGSKTNWSSAADDPPTTMLDLLWAALPRHAVVVLVSVDRHGLPARTPAHRTFKHGRRHIKIYRHPQL